MRRTITLTKNAVANLRKGKTLVIAISTGTLTITAEFTSRKCICGKTFFPKRRNQGSCSTTCRDKAYSHTDEYRAKKREIMRKNYAAKQKAKAAGVAV